MGLRSTLAKALTALALGALSLSLSAQPTASGNPIVVGQQFPIRSETMGEMRSYLVHRPANYDFSNARYPLLIVLDGRSDFRHVSATVDFLAGAQKIPPMLVVGIPNTNRSRDLIPPAHPAGSASGGKGARGGAANFLRFIAAELIPKLEHDYRTQPYRILVGHSDGGLFALYSLLNAPGVFNGYIVASPAFGDSRGLPKSVGSFLEQHKNLAGGMYLTTADESGQILSGTWELSSYLQDWASRDPRWSFAFRRYPEESHDSVTLRSVYDGLEYLFDGWQIHDPFALYEEAGLPAIEKHFAILSARLGLPVAVPAQALLETFFRLEGGKRFTEAERVVLRTIELYPDDADAYFYAGRLYLEMGNDAKARQYLKKSLVLSPRRRAWGGPYTALKIDADAVVPIVDVSTGDLEECVGAYGTSAAVLEIVRRGDKLFARTADGEDELNALSGSRFYFSNADEVITFHRDDRGRVVSLVFQNGGAELAKLK